MSCVMQVYKERTYMGGWFSNTCNPIMSEIAQPALSSCLLYNECMLLRIASSHRDRASHSFMIRLEMSLVPAGKDCKRGSGDERQRRHAMPCRGSSA